MYSNPLDLLVIQSLKKKKKKKKEIMKKRFGFFFPPIFGSANLPLLI